MQRRIVPNSLVLLAALCLVACNKGDDVEVIEPSNPTPKTYTFDGKPDPSLEGTWKDTRADIRYTFTSDGKFTYKGTVNSPGGQIKIDGAGDVGTDAEFIYFRDKDGLVSKKALKREGDTLKMTSLGEVKIETTYKKE